VLDSDAGSDNVRLAEMNSGIYGDSIDHGLCARVNLLTL
jgi:hypothetical protein